MRRLALASTALCLVAACSNELPSDPEDSGSELSSHAVTQTRAPGRIATVLSLTPVTDMLEGIAVDHRGNIFVSNRRLEGETRTAQILRISRTGSLSLFATLDQGIEDEITAGPLGLAADSKGDLYAAVPTGHRNTHGVWRIRPDGSARRLARSRRMRLPDALAFDARGNLYVTDAEVGSIWRFTPSGTGALWLQDDLLFGQFGLGANGIAFVPPRTLYVANTDNGAIVRVPIRPDGSPGRPSLVVQSPELLVIDGLAADVHGDLYAVMPLAGVFGIAPLAKVDPETGAITPVTEMTGRFDFPTSLAFGSGPLDRKSLYVVNSGIFGAVRPEAAPGVIRVSVGVPGAPVR